MQQHCQLKDNSNHRRFVHCSTYCEILPVSPLEKEGIQMPPFAKPVLPAPVPQARVSPVEGGAARSAGGFCQGLCPCRVVRFSCTFLSKDRHFLPSGIFA